jgi:hypothetical protein
MGNRGQVHDFLHAALDQHCEAGLAACHNVAVITEDVQGLGSNGTCRNIEHAGQLLSSDLVHVGDHQQQALRSGEGGGNSTCTQRAVHSAGSAGLRLHLDDLDLVAEDVLLASCGPLVHRVSHRRRRGNGVDGSHVRVGICYMSGSGISMVCFALGIFLPPLFRIWYLLRGAISAPAGPENPKRHYCSYTIITNSASKVNANPLAKRNKISRFFLLVFYACVFGGIHSCRILSFWPMERFFLNFSLILN